MHTLTRKASAEKLKSYKTNAKLEFLLPVNSRELDALWKMVSEMSHSIFGFSLILVLDLPPIGVQYARKNS